MEIFSDGDPHVETPWMVGGRVAVESYVNLLKDGFEPSRAEKIVLAALLSHDPSVEPTEYRERVYWSSLSQLRALQIASLGIS